MSHRNDRKARFSVRTEKPLDQSKTGFYAVVCEDRGGDNPAMVYDSYEQQGNSGLFPNSSSARKHGNRWIEARLDQMERVEALREQRRAALPDALRASMDEEEHHKDERAFHTKQIDLLKKKRGRLIDEARNPHVKIEFRASAEDFSIFDEPSESAGTLDEKGNPTADPRQQWLPGTSEPPEEPGAGDGDGDGDGPRKPPRRKPRGAPRGGDGDGDGDVPPRTGLDPNAVKWPEDDDETGEGDGDGEDA